jgi:hypothetical protein
MGFTRDQLDAMVRDADRMLDWYGGVGAHEVSCHVKVLAAEVARLTRSESEAWDAQIASIGSLQERVVELTRQNESLMIRLHNVTR